MKKWLISAIVLTMMLSLSGCWWLHHRHHGYAGERDGYDHHDRGRDHDWDGDRDHNGNREHDRWR